MLIILRSWSFAFRCQFHQPNPKYPLFLPVRHDRNSSHFAFAETGDGVGGWFEIKDRLLDVGGEIGQVDNLRDTAALLTTRTAILFAHDARQIFYLAPWLSRMV